MFLFKSDKSLVLNKTKSLVNPLHVTEDGKTDKCKDVCHHMISLRVFVTT